MSYLISPAHLSSLLTINELYLHSNRSLFFATVAEIGSLCSNKDYETVHYFISFLDQLIDLHSSVKYRSLIERHLASVVYADLTDHFISYPIVLQTQIMTMIDNCPSLRFPLIRAESESDQSKIDLFLQDAGTMTTSLLFRRLSWMSFVSFSSSSIFPQCVFTFIIPSTGLSSRWSFGFVSIDRSCIDHRMSLSARDESFGILGWTLPASLVTTSSTVIDQHGNVLSCLVANRNQSVLLRSSRLSRSTINCSFA